MFVVGYLFVFSLSYSSSQFFFRTSFFVLLWMYLFHICSFIDVVCSLWVGCRFFMFFHCLVCCFGLTAFCMWLIKIRLHGLAWHGYQLCVRRYMYTLMHWLFAWLILNKHRTYKVIIIRHWIRLRTWLFLTTICEGKEIHVVHRNSQVRFKISINYKKSYSVHAF